jgi:alpha-tubulin suppressor-like RCC1 family protein
LQVALGFEHACALQRDGTVWCWGRQLGGALGNGVDTDADLALPTRVLGLSGASEIALGGSYGCATKSASGLVCWGLSTYSVNTSTIHDIDSKSLFAVLTPGALHRLVAGETHQCALTSSGAVCRGNNSSGQLGNDSYVASLVASSAENTFAPVVDSTRFVEIAADQGAACALTSDERVLCWGAYLPTTMRSVPTEITF